MIIYRASNTQVFDAPVTSAAVHKATLMKEDYIKLSFVDVVDYHFKAGDYVTWEGQNYYLNKDYVPTMKDEATFSYELQFNAPWYNLDSYIFFYNTYHIEDGTETITKRESDWYITDTASNIISLIIRNTQDDTRDCPCVFDSVFYCEGTTVKTFTFSSTSILAALNNLAKEFELEWWVEVNDGKHYIHFGECDKSIVTDEYGSVIFNPDGSRKKRGTADRNLTSGQNVTAPTISNKNDIKKRYFVYGSSRNIDQTVDMLSQEDGTYVSSLVTKRLAMDGNPQEYKEGAVDPIITEDLGFGEEVVIFDDIYPRSDWQVTNVTPIDMQSEEIEGYDESGNPVYKKYKVYNVRLGSAHKEGETWVVDDPNGFSDYVFSLIEATEQAKEDLLAQLEAGTITQAEYEELLANLDGVEYIGDVIASGKELSLKFIIKNVDSTTLTPVLAGFEFELGAFLNVNTPDGQGNKAFPDKSNDYQWYEFQIIKKDINGYIIPNDALIPNIGDWICLFNIKGKYIDANELSNAQNELWEAFKKYYKNLKKDISYTVKPYVDRNLSMNIGDSVLLIYGRGGDRSTVRSRISSFEKKLDYASDASYTISSFVQPSTVNQLKEEVKTITANIANGRAFQLDGEAISTILDTYGKKMFLSKTQDDEASGKITFAKGAKVKASIGTPVFIDGFTGSGWQIDSAGNLTLNNLTVRQTMRVFELLVQQVRATGGEIIVSPANGKIKSVNEKEGEGTGGFPLIFPVTFPQTQGDMYVCTIDDGENNNGSFSYGNMFKVGDWVRCQRWNKLLNTTHSYWVCVAKVNGNDIYLPKSQFSQGCVPEVGDELVLMGNVSDTNRQGVISITATDDGKPRIAVYNGIHTTSLEGCTRLVLGDLNGIEDDTLTPSGYGLYSDNVFLKGKLAMSNGTLIEEGFVNITDGLANSGINISNGTITLRSDKTEFKNSENVTISAFTDEGIQAYKVNCLDEDGNTRIRLDKDGLKMYYPNGQIMKEEAMVFEEKIVDGVRTITLKGVETRYYSADGALLWRLDSTGVLSNSTLNEYWTHYAVHYITQLPEYTEVGGKKIVNGGDYGSIGTKENNSIVSMFHSTAGSEHAQTTDGRSSTGFLTLGEVTSGVPDACYNGNITGLTGYYLSDLSSKHDSGDSDYLFYYEFSHCVDGWYVEGERLYFYDDPYSGGKD